MREGGVFEDCAGGAIDVAHRFSEDWPCAGVSQLSLLFCSSPGVLRQNEMLRI